MSDQRIRFIVVRHGETDWNVEARHQGHMDSPLTERGVAQVQALGERLRDVGIDELVSSDLPRAVQTAQHLLACRAQPLPMRCTAALRERHLGIFGGLTPADAAARYPAQYAAFCSGDPDYRPQGGESQRDLYLRMSAAMDALAADYKPGQTVLVVSHGAALGQFLRYVLGIPLEAPRACKFVNAAYNEFSHPGTTNTSATQGKWLLHVWGAVDHFGSLSAEDDI